MVEYALGALIPITCPPAGIHPNQVCRQDCLRSIDEVFVLGLGTAAMVVPVQASGCQLHSVPKIDTLITWR